MAQPGQPESEAQNILDSEFIVGQNDWLRKLYVVATCIFTATVPIILLAGLWIWTMLSESRQEIENYMIVRAVQVTHQVDALMTEQISVLRAFSSLPSLRSDNLELFQRNITNMKGMMPQWKVISLFDAETGDLLIDTLGSEKQPSSPGMIRQINRAVESRDATVCTCYVNEDPDSPKHGIHIFIPIFRDDAVRYVLSATLRFDPLQRLVVAASSPYYVVGIVDENDAIIARALGDEGFRGKLPTEDFQLRPKGADKMVGSFSGRAFAGTVNTSAFSRSALTGWGIITGAGTESVDTLAARSNWALFATGALSLILAAVLAIIVIYNMMLRRIGAERMAVSVAVGNLQTRLLTTTREALEEQSKAASEREVLLRELYHRVKNNLQIIQSLLRLSARSLSPEQKEPFEMAVRRIGAMARVHTLLYNSSNLSFIDLRDYLPNIVAETAAGFDVQAHNIRSELDIQSMHIPLDSAFPIAFITTELLANSFKHAFPEGRGGEVRVTAKREGDNGVLIISDDGVGISEKTLKVKPLGLKLVDKLVEQIGGSMVLPEVGQSTYRIEFPLAKKKEQPDAPA